MEPTPHTVAFVERVPVCEGTASFVFERPEGYTFAAGQHFALTLQTAEGEQTKHFSHCDAPGDERSQLTTRLTGSPFKSALEALRPGDPVAMTGPYGELTIGEGVTKAAFLVGGVGITPARSIVRDSVLRRTGLTALVFDGNLDQSCIPFLKEFREYEQSGPLVRFVHVLEKPSSAWAGERGFITAEIVRRHCDPFDGWHWYVAGPPAMTKAMDLVISSLELPSGRVSREPFSGYA
jgi:ferredoxin-NADP reductase